MKYDDQFGSTAQAHQEYMPILWGPIINISIFLLRYYYGKISLVIHIIFGLLALTFTLATSIPINNTADQDSQIVQLYQTNQSVDLKSHYNIGFVCIYIVCFEVFLGFASRIANFCQAKSIIITRINILHKILGYVLLILCKVNIYIISIRKNYGILIQDVVCLIIILLWKFLQPRMRSQISPQIENPAEIRQIKSMSQLPTQNNYCMFANYVYDLQPLKIFHPVGFEVIASIRSKQVDRYIYGMYASEELPEISKHSHLARSFSLLDKPIAKINIPSPYEGQLVDQMPAKIQSLQIISEEGNIYLMRLKCQNRELNFKGYESWEQLGRYYSITFNKYTRLYTSVNFLTIRNQKLMEKILKIQIKSIKVGQGQDKNSKTLLTIQQRENNIPILFKKYTKGKLTEPLVQSYPLNIQNLILSCPKGEGLKLTQLKPGKIIIVVGGTGIYPFSDLIDLLFKEQLMKNQRQFIKEFSEISPVLGSRPFKNFSFHLMGAFNQLNNIHPITLKQLFFLSKNHPSFKLTIKTKQKLDASFAEQKIFFHHSSFNTLLAYQLQELNGISKIYICGPPKMNEQLSAFLRNNPKSENLYSIL